MYAHRINSEILEHSLQGPFITALLGPRRVGKTSFAQHYAQTHNQNKIWVFLNMDSMEERRRVAKGELPAMIEESAEQKIGGIKPIWIAIDEAQKSSPLFEEVKILYDRYKDKGCIKFILTGSGFLTLHRMTSETLAGRIQIHYLREFCLRENAALSSTTEIPPISLLDALILGPEALKNVAMELSPFKRILTQALSQELCFGGLPEVLLQPTLRDRLDYFSNYLQTYFEKDVRDLETISDLPLYRKLMDILAQQTGSIRDDGKILASLGCSRETLMKYRGILEATLFYIEVYPFIGSTLKRLIKSPKGYLCNNGMISYLTGLEDLSVLEKTGVIGQRMENWVLKELQIWLDRDSHRSHICYWRTRDGVEVDFVVDRAPCVYPFEVTYGTEPRREKIRSLKVFLAQEPKATWAYYIYQGDFKIDSENRIIFLPAWMLS
ncbi:MAG: AAA family ATPase [Myxococcaceae bacterium]